MGKRPGAFKVATRFEQKRYNAAAFRKEDTDLLHIANQALKKAKRDGTLEKLQIRWFGGSMGPIPDDWVPQE
jgi:polar amino acid transport system substrate-binding protein